MTSLTVDELREHVTTSLGDDALERLLAAAWQAIAEVTGAEGDVTEFVNGGGSFIILSRPTTVADIASVKEWTGFSYERTLDALDYRLRSDGMSLQRLGSGPTPSGVFVGPVEIVYTPTGDDARRQVVQLALVNLFLNHHPGVTSESIGDWAETFAANSVFNYAIERDRILETLRVPSLGFA